ncbi:MAG TPA: ribosomal-protein-alanine N-acetyltransferase [Thermopetrobacter sp.]|nr:ribosomal-protein-alanine N-acetyltransferase [Thermopetrobacter sp.]
MTGGATAATAVRLRIRRAGVDDAAGLAAIHEAAFAGTGERGWREEEIARLIADDTITTLLATLADGRPAGFVMTRLGGLVADILSIAVAPAFQRRGIGGRLLAAALTDAAAGGAGRVFLEVAADNAAAQALYRQQKFEPVGVRKNYYRRADGSRADALVLLLPIGGGCGCDELS